MKYSNIIIDTYKTLKPKMAKQIKDFVTKNILPFPNPIDFIVGFAQIMDFIYYKITKKVYHTFNYRYWKNLAEQIMGD